MPSFPPRTEPIKKADQLAQRRIELNSAVQKNYKGVKLTKAVEKYRTAQLSFLKAKMHVLLEKSFHKNEHDPKIDKLEAIVKLWESKTEEGIIDESRK